MHRTLRKRGRVSRVLKASHDKAEIARLNTSLDRLSGDLGLAGIATVDIQAGCFSLAPPSCDECMQ